MFLVNLGSPVHFSDSKPDVQIKAPIRVVEIAVDIDISVLDTNAQIGVERDLRLAFRQIMSQKLGEALQQAYSVKREGTTIPGLIKVPIDSLEAILLKKSGAHGFYFREKLRGNSEPAFRLALIHQTHLRDENFNRSIDIAKETPHFYGIHRTNKGSLSLSLSLCVSLLPALKTLDKVCAKKACLMNTMSIWCQPCFFKFKDFLLVLIHPTLLKVYGNGVGLLWPLSRGLCRQAL